MGVLFFSNKKKFVNRLPIWTHYGHWSIRRMSSPANLALHANQSDHSLLWSVHNSPTVCLCRGQNHTSRYVGVQGKLKTMDVFSLPRPFLWKSKIIKKIFKEIRIIKMHVVWHCDMCQLIHPFISKKTYTPIINWHKLTCR